MGYIGPGINGWLYNIKAKKPFSRGRLAILKEKKEDDLVFSPKTIHHKRIDKNERANKMLQSIKSIQLFTVFKRKIALMILVIVGAFFIILLIYTIISIFKDFY